MICRSTGLALFLALIFAGCSDDTNNPTPDGPVQNDIAIADQGPTPDQGPAAEQGVVVDSGPQAELGTGDGSSANTFNIELTIKFGTFVGCNASDTNKDCVGTLYWSVYDTPPPTDPKNKGTPIFEGQEANVKEGSVVKATVPWAAKLYLAMFLDDNDNVDPTAVGPDKSDPVFSDSALGGGQAGGFTATVGQTVKRTITFPLRMPL